MLITPPDFGLGLLVLEGCGPLFLGAWRHPLRRRFLVCGFTVVELLHCLARVRTGLLVPSAADPGPGRCLACHSTAPTLQFLYSGQARSGTFAFRRGSRAVKALPESRRTRLVMHPDVQVSPLVSDASGWARPPWPAGATWVNHTDHDGGQRGRQCPGAGVPNGILGSSPPTARRRRRRRLSGHLGRDQRPTRTPQPLPRAQATNLWLRRELSLSADRASTVKSTSSAGKSRETRVLPTEPLGIGPIGLRL